MDKQIFDLLVEMHGEIKTVKSGIVVLRSEMHDELKSIKSDVDSLRTEMHDELKSIKSDVDSLRTEMHDLRTEMHDRFNAVNVKLQGVGDQFEITNEARINDVAFITDKINHMEKELFILKNRKSV